MKERDKEREGCGREKKKERGGRGGVGTEKKKEGDI